MCFFFFHCLFFRRRRRPSVVGSCVPGGVTCPRGAGMPVGRRLCLIHHAFRGSNLLQPDAVSTRTHTRTRTRTSTHRQPFADGYVGGVKSVFSGFASKRNQFRGRKKTTKRTNEWSLPPILFLGLILLLSWFPIDQSFLFFFSPSSCFFNWFHSCHAGFVNRKVAAAAAAAAASLELGCRAKEAAEISSDAPETNKGGARKKLAGKKSKQSPRKGQKNHVGNADVVIPVLDLSSP